MSVYEIAPDFYRLSSYIPEFGLQFNQFLVVDDEPLLYHTGMRSLFPQVRELVSKVIDPRKIRKIGFSHFEADECGALNQWLAVAKDAEPFCSEVGSIVSLNDFSDRPVRGLKDNERFSTGKYSWRLVRTPHVPHCWEASLLFEEKHGTLLCSDLFTHSGDVEPLTESDIVGRFRDDLIAGEDGPLADAYPYSEKTARHLARLAAINPSTLAVMHGSSFRGNGEEALVGLADVMEEVLANDSTRTSTNRRRHLASA